MGCGKGVFLAGLDRLIEGLRMGFQGAKQEGKQGQPAIPLGRSFHTRPIKGGVTPGLAYGCFFASPVRATSADRSQ